MKIGLLGMGTIGSGVYGQVANHRKISVGRILDKRRIEGVESLLTTSMDDILGDSSLDTVVELMGGAEPARTFALEAMKAGKNFVSANKLMIARCLPELLAAAAENGVQIRFSAAVGGGIPFLYNLLRAKRCDRITSVGGIVNGTTNFILDRMQTFGMDFDAALETARTLGYAEANPASDIDGLDAQNKIAIVASLAFDAFVPVEEIPTEGIGRLRTEDMAAARSMGMVVRFLARAYEKDGALSAAVEPTMVPAGNVYAGVTDNFNMISFSGRYAGEMRFMGQGAGKDPTAFAVVGDLTDILEKNPLQFSCGCGRAVRGETPARRYYVRTDEKPDCADKTLFTTGSAGSYTTYPISARAMHQAAADARARGREIAFAAIDE